MPQNKLEKNTNEHDKEITKKNTHISSREWQKIIDDLRLIQ